MCLRLRIIYLKDIDICKINQVARNVSIEDLKDDLVSYKKDGRESFPSLKGRSHNSTKRGRWRWNWNVDVDVEEVGGGRGGGG